MGDGSFGNLDKNSNEYNTALNSAKRLYTYCTSVGINHCMSHIGYGWFYVGLDKVCPKILKEAGYQFIVKKDSVKILLSYFHDGGADANLMSGRLKGLLSTHLEKSNIQGIENCSPSMMRDTIYLGCPGEGDLKVVYFGSIGGKSRSPRQTELIAEVLGIEDDVKFKEKLGLYPIPNHGIDLLLGTDVKAPMMIPLATLGLSHPVELPGLHLLKHEFQEGFSFSGRIGVKVESKIVECLPSLMHPPQRALCTVPGSPIY